MKITHTNVAPMSDELRTAMAEFEAGRIREGREINSVEIDTGPIARTLDEFMKSMGNDPAELLKHRYLCRGGALLLVGPTGHGKSSLAMQLMIKWALGQAVFGIEPARPIKSLLIQAENDDGDLAEMKAGVFNGLNLTEEEQEGACKNVFVTQESSTTGSLLCSDVIEPLLRTIKPDLLWIDPALAYIGSDMNSQKDVGTFLRNYLAPLLTKYNCGAVIIHHTNKISRDPDKQMNDYTYLGAGSAEWSNWSRAIIALNKTDVDNLYELIAAKRGGRLKWKTADGESLTMKRYIGHSKRPDTICWTEMAIADAEELRANNGKSAEDVMKHVPQEALVAKDALIKLCRQNGIGKNLTTDLINELLDDDQLFEVSVPRAAKRPKVLLSRKPVTLNPGLVLDACPQNSQGHYTIPHEPEPVKKVL
jgi:RecA-family ATPase